MNDSIFPPIMANAKTDLAGNIDGQFSPEDWQKILSLASEQLKTSNASETEAWIEVIRDFHRNKYWGFVPNYKKPKTSVDEKNLGAKFIWFSFRSFLITKVVVLYAGARYTNDDSNPIWKYLFFGAFAFMLTAYGTFLYRYAGRKESDGSSSSSSDSVQ